MKTYGGEIEFLCINKNNKLVPITKENINRAKELDTNDKDLRGSMVDFGYDSSLHLGEIGSGVTDSLTSIFERTKKAVISIVKALEEDEKFLIDASAYPYTDEKDLITDYNNNVLNKLVYNVIRGVRDGNETLEKVLSTIYGDGKVARNWKHYIGTDKAAIQPWNQLDPQNAGGQIAAILMCGFLFNLLTANSPDGEYRDTRAMMWDPVVGIMSTSKVEKDKNLVRAPKEFLMEDGSAKGISSYLNYVFSNQVPKIFPQPENASTQYKSDFLINGDITLTFLDILKKNGRKGIEENGEDSKKYYSEDGKELSEEERSITVYDPTSGEKLLILPSVGITVNGFDYLYFPRFGARIRIFIKNPEKIDPYSYANAIEEGNDAEVIRLMQEGGIDGVGFGILAEGRVAATNLPTNDNDWSRTAISFVLQTAITRSYNEVLKIFRENKVGWEEAVEDLPQRTNLMSNNSEKVGFETQTNSGLNVTELGMKIWDTIKKSLSQEELDLIMSKGEDIIEKILKTKAASAENKLAAVGNPQGSSVTKELFNNIEKYKVVLS